MAMLNDKPEKTTPAQHCLQAQKLMELAQVAEQDGDLESARELRNLARSHVDDVGRFLELACK